MRCRESQTRAKASQSGLRRAKRDMRKDKNPTHAGQDPSHMDLKILLWHRSRSHPKRRARHIISPNRWQPRGTVHQSNAFVQWHNNRLGGGWFCGLRSNTFCHRAFDFCQWHCSAISHARRRSNQRAIRKITAGCTILISPRKTQPARSVFAQRPTL